MKFVPECLCENLIEDFAVLESGATKMTCHCSCKSEVQIGVCIDFSTESFFQLGVAVGWVSHGGGLAIVRMLSLAPAGFPNRGLTHTTTVVGEGDAMEGHSLLGFIGPYSSVYPDLQFARDGHADENLMCIQREKRVFLKVNDSSQ